jgi:hypothetical protein
MGGLLAARVLSDFYGTVTVVERDKLPVTADQRRGVPQGRHFHVLWSRGAHELAELFPGIHDDLIAAGAAVCDDGDLSRVSIRVAGHELSREGKFSDPSAVKLHLLSRPLLESHVRQRVGAIDNVEILDGHDFVEPIAPTPQRVTGAKIVNRDTEEQRILEADLVVDAMGRGARTPAFLEDQGYGRRTVDDHRELHQSADADPGGDHQRTDDVRRSRAEKGYRRRLFGVRARHVDFHADACRGQRTTRHPYRDDPDGHAVRAAGVVAGTQAR